ncbi:DEAD (Asp-Glu-Ala-Asp) box polypeptide 20 [Entomortierella beljakovae]|nr:DEAD (Asp-Glu-Ala-Asp) box polypeptide 20 [Entomortierella beljakovae]
MTLDRFHSKDVQINEDLDFSSLVQHPVLLAGLIEAGYQRPSPIQLKAIPLGRLGLDLIAQAKSGTGKTIVFSVIAIEAALSGISVDSNGLVRESEEAKGTRQPKAVIIAPTREIAVQIQEVILNLIQSGLSDSISCHPFIGGIPIQADKENLKCCSIVVGTPGRVRSLITSGHLSTSQIRLLVLDEADKLMEDPFKDDVFAIAKKMGQTKQVMAFSATYDDDLLSQLDNLVKNPVYVMLSNGTPELEGKSMDLELILRAAELAKHLTRKGWTSMHIASGISQEERLEVMKKARKFELRVLVCSDLIARGIDIDRVNLVVNLDLPKDPETYLHRIGRTGRYGTTGLAVNIVSEEELGTIEILRKEYGITIGELPVTDNHFVELNQRSMNRHHERPLQTPNDLERFKALEAERLEGKRRVLSEDSSSNIQDAEEVAAEACNKSFAKRAAPESESLEQSRFNSKRKKNSRNSNYSLLTPEMTPPVDHHSDISCEDGGHVHSELQNQFYPQYTPPFE